MQDVILLGQVLVDGGLDLSDKRVFFNGAGCVTSKLGMEQSDDGDCWALLLTHDICCHQHWLEGLHNLFGI